ncbi:MAG: hypothetical protein JWM80_6126 [Cyanobacteria bacterium RYN_339]|nr:hypothetical protein [Cyanobacteria bacterium RYN_339]
MKLNLLPTLAVALVAVAMGCTTGPGTATAPIAVSEGRVATSGNSGGQPAAVDTTVTQSIGGAPTGQRVTTPAQPNTAVAVTAAPQVVAPAVQPPKADGGVAVSAPAGTDHVGRTVALPPGELLTPHLDDVPSPTPVPSPTQPSNSTAGTTQPAASPTTFAALTFNPMRVFNPTAAIQVIDYARVVAIDGTTLYVTTDAGANWTVYDNVGRQSLRCLSFISESSGWVAGENGALLQVSITNGTLTYKVLNSGTSSRIPALHFAPAAPQFGYYADENGGTLRKTADGGLTWGAAIADGTTVPVNQKSGFRPDSADGALYLPNDPMKSPGAFTTLYQLQGGKFFAQLSAKSKQSFSSLTQYSPLVTFKDAAQPSSTWYITSDWKTFGTFSSDMLTPTQLLRGGLADAAILDGTTMVGKTTDGKIAISQDLGQSWSDPLAPNRSLTWFKPFSTTQMWGYDAGQNTLYRAGIYP